MSTGAVEVAGSSAVESVELIKAHRRTVWQVIRGNPLALAGAVVVGLWVLLAIAAPLVTPYDPISSQDAYNTLAPPTTAHLLGTDDNGRDLLSRLAYGGRASLGIGVV